MRYKICLPSGFFGKRQKKMFHLKTTNHFIISFIPLQILIFTFFLTLVGIFWSQNYFPFFFQILNVLVSFSLLYIFLSIFFCTFIIFTFTFIALNFTYVLCSFLLLMIYSFYFLYLMIVSFSMIIGKNKSLKLMKQLATTTPKIIL